MSYVVLARRYRPQRFDELIGQEHVALTLRNAVKLGRTSHAYLFTGPRGTGKTSTARLLAKALRCEQRSSDGEACNKCESCLSVISGNSLDVMEIDAASNTGVDNIRELRENVGFAASSGKYRVYIIDEVHMLSTAAFNALLKTLEEPPPHVVFIFATTELHKVLPTILSRCQRFDFKKIPPEPLAQSLRVICEKEKIKIDEASLRTLVVESDGCLRDAQSLLDQAIAFCGQEITIDKLEQALGLLDRASFMALMRAVGTRDAGAALKLSTQMLAKGIDAKILLGRLVEFLRDLHYRCFTGESPVQDPELEPLLAELVETLSEDEIVRAMELALRTQASLNSATNAALTVEALVVKLCLQRPVGGSVEVETAPPRTDSGPRRPVSTPATPILTEPTLRSKQPERAAAGSEQAERAPVHVSIASDREQSGRAVFNGADIKDLENYIRASKPAWTPVLASVLSLSIEGNLLKARVKPDFAGKRLSSQDGVELLKAAFKTERALVELAERGVTAPIVDPALARRERAKQAREHESVRAAVDIFGGSITDSKILDEERPNKGDMS